MIRTVHVHTRGPAATYPPAIDARPAAELAARCLADVLLEGDRVFARAVARGDHDLASRLYRAARTAPIVFCDRCACCHIGGCPAEEIDR